MAAHRGRDPAGLAFREHRQHGLDPGGAEGRLPPGGDAAPRGARGRRPARPGGLLAARRRTYRVTRGKERTRDHAPMMAVRSRYGSPAGSGSEPAPEVGAGFGLRGSLAPAPPPRPG